MTIICDCTFAGYWSDERTTSETVQTSSDRERGAPADVERQAATEREEHRERVGVAPVELRVRGPEQADQAEHRERGAEERVDHPRVDVAEPAR